jgi:hypothetical protein
MVTKKLIYHKGHDRICKSSVTIEHQVSHPLTTVFYPLWQKEKRCFLPTI